MTMATPQKRNRASLSTTTDGPPASAGGDLCRSLTKSLRDLLAGDYRYGDGGGGGESRGGDDDVYHRYLNSPPRANDADAGGTNGIDGGNAGNDGGEPTGSARAAERRWRGRAAAWLASAADEAGVGSADAALRFRKRRRGTVSIGEEEEFADGRYLVWLAGEVLAGPIGDGGGDSDDIGGRWAAALESWHLSMLGLLDRGTGGGLDGDDGDAEAGVLWRMLLDGLGLAPQSLREGLESHASPRGEHFAWPSFFRRAARDHVSWWSLLGYAAAHATLSVPSGLPAGGRVRRLADQSAPSLSDALDLPGYGEGRAALRAGAAACVLDHVGEWIVLDGLALGEAEERSPRGEGGERRINAEVCDRMRAGVEVVVDLLLQDGIIPMLARLTRTPLSSLVAESADALLNYSEVHHRLRLRSHDAVAAQGEEDDGEGEGDGDARMRRRLAEDALLVVRYIEGADPTLRLQLARRAFASAARRAVPRDDDDGIMAPLHPVAVDVRARLLVEGGASAAARTCRALEDCAGVDEPTKRHCWLLLLEWMHDVGALFEDGWNVAPSTMEDDDVGGGVGATLANVDLGPIGLACALDYLGGVVAEAEAVLNPPGGAAPAGASSDELPCVKDAVRRTVLKLLLPRAYAPSEALRMANALSRATAPPALEDPGGMGKGGGNAADAACRILARPSLYSTWNGEGRAAETTVGEARSARQTDVDDGTVPAGEVEEGPFAEGKGAEVVMLEEMDEEERAPRRERRGPPKGAAEEQEAECVKENSSEEMDAHVDDEDASEDEEDEECEETKYIERSVESIDEDRLDYEMKEEEEEEENATYPPRHHEYAGNYSESDDYEEEDEEEVDRRLAYEGEYDEEEGGEDSEEEEELSPHRARPRKNDTVEILDSSEEEGEHLDMEGNAKERAYLEKTNDMKALNEKVDKYIESHKDVERSIYGEDANGNNAGESSDVMNESDHMEQGGEERILCEAATDLPTSGAKENDARQVEGEETKEELDDGEVLIDGKTPAPCLKEASGITSVTGDLPSDRTPAAGRKETAEDEFEVRSLEDNENESGILGKSEDDEEDRGEVIIDGETPAPGLKEAFELEAVGDLAGDQIPAADTEEIAEDEFEVRSLEDNENESGILDKSEDDEEDRSEVLIDRGTSAPGPNDASVIKLVPGDLPSDHIPAATKETAEEEFDIRSLKDKENEVGNLDKSEDKQEGCSEILIHKDLPAPDQKGAFVIKAVSGCLPGDQTPVAATKEIAEEEFEVRSLEDNENKSGILGKSEYEEEDRGEVLIDGGTSVSGLKEASGIISVTGDLPSDRTPAVGRKETAEDEFEVRSLDDNENERGILDKSEDKEEDCGEILKGGSVIERKEEPCVPTELKNEQPFAVAANEEENEKASLEHEEAAEKEVGGDPEPEVAKDSPHKKAEKYVPAVDVLYSSDGNLATADDADDINADDGDDEHSESIDTEDDIKHVEEEVALPSCEPPPPQGGRPPALHGSSVTGIDADEDGEQSQQQQQQQPSVLVAAAMSSQNNFEQSTIVHSSRSGAFEAEGDNQSFDNTSAALVDVGANLWENYDDTSQGGTDVDGDGDVRVTARIHGHDSTLGSVLDVHADADDDSGEESSPEDAAKAGKAGQSKSLFEGQILTDDGYVPDAEATEEEKQNPNNRSKDVISSGYVPDAEATEEETHARRCPTKPSSMKKAEECVILDEGYVPDASEASEVEQGGSTERTATLHTSALDTAAIDVEMPTQLSIQVPATIQSIDEGYVPSSEENKGDQIKAGGTQHRSQKASLKVAEAPSIDEGYVPDTETIRKRSPRRAGAVVGFDVRYLPAAEEAAIATQPTAPLAPEVQTINEWQEEVKNPKDTRLDDNIDDGYLPSAVEGTEEEMSEKEETAFPPQSADTFAIADTNQSQESFPPPSEATMPSILVATATALQASLPGKSDEEKAQPPKESPQEIKDSSLIHDGVHHDAEKLAEDAGAIQSSTAAAVFMPNLKPSDEQDIRTSFEQDKDLGGKVVVEGDAEGMKSETAVVDPSAAATKLHGGGKVDATMKENAEKEKIMPARDQIENEEKFARVVDAEANVTSDIHKDGMELARVAADGPGTNGVEGENVLEPAKANESVDDLSLLTIVQLKDRLRKLNLKLSGRKQDLIDRLNSHLNPTLQEAGDDSESVAAGSKASKTSRKRNASSASVGSKPKSRSAGVTSARKSKRLKSIREHDTPISALSYSDSDASDKDNESVQEVQEAHFSGTTTRSSRRLNNSPGVPTSIVTRNKGGKKSPSLPVLPEGEIVEGSTFGAEAKGKIRESSSSKKRTHPKRSARHMKKDDASETSDTDMSIGSRTRKSKRSAGAVIDGGDASCASTASKKARGGTGASKRTEESEWETGAPKRGRGVKSSKADADDDASTSTEQSARRSAKKAEEPESLGTRRSTRRKRLTEKASASIVAKKERESSSVATRRSTRSRANK